MKTRKDKRTTNRAIIVMNAHNGNRPDLKEEVALQPLSFMAPSMAVTLQ
jgi:hypothetical protein